ncbi:MAG: EamA family transporter, partial [Chloroflexota bacterium]|nr:EamA family transporter [Chloroflexota bacterium]
VGGLILLIVSLGLREHAPNLAKTESLWALGFLIVFGSLVAFTAYGYLLRHVRPALATSYAYVNPMVAVALGALMAGEHITGIELVAMLITLGGVGLVSLGRGK